MEDAIKSALGSSILRRTSGGSGGGCISEGEAYETDDGIVFIKKNSKKEARRMFDGEFQGLKALLATNTVRVPKPLAVVDNPNGGAVLVTEYVEMSSLRKHAAMLGEQLARLHKHNVETADDDGRVVVDQFGFHCTTCCGFIPQDNTWCSDWVTFFTEQKLQAQADMIAKDDRQFHDLWPKLKERIPRFFEGLETVKPALLHGDLWAGNAAETPNEAIVFDPATFYGHSEYDLAISQMFGGFSAAFFAAYHSAIPKASGFEVRSRLYQLFHYLNHWNHFGGGYRSTSMSIMKKLIGA